MEKNFGYTFAIFFLLIAFYLKIVENDAYVVAIYIFIFFLISTIFLSKIFIYPSRLWLKFGIFLNKIISPPVIFLVYTLTILPIGLLIKLLKIDLINQKKDINRNSYWEKKEKNINSFHDQF